MLKWAYCLSLANRVQLLHIILSNLNELQVLEATAHCTVLVYMVSCTMLSSPTHVMFWGWQFEALFHVCLLELSDYLLLSNLANIR